MPSASNNHRNLKLEKQHRLHTACAGVHAPQTKGGIVVFEEVRLRTIPATVTVHLDDAVGQLGELKELLCLLGHNR